MVKVSPKIPSTVFGFGPIPEAPCGDRSLIHIWGIESIIEFGPFCIVAKIALTDVVACIVVKEVIASDGDCDLDDSTCPPIIESSIYHGEGSILYCYSIEWSLE
jgi:hypothetical protein